jgi:uncharacterized protein YfaP (DUF2135 family)
MRRALWAVIGMSALAACRSKPAEPPPPPALPAGVQAPAPAVRVSLVWSAPVDLDLYVTDPSQETVYFANPRAQSGGKLGHDVACAGVSGHEGPWVEDVSWDRAPRGRYRVGVDFIQRCSSDLEEASFRVVAEVSGKREEKTGTVHRERFEPVVLEFDVP